MHVLILGAQVDSIKMQDRSAIDHKIQPDRPVEIVLDTLDIVIVGVGDAVEVIPELVPLLPLFGPGPQQGRV